MRINLEWRLNENDPDEVTHRWLGGVGKATTRIMFVQTCVTEEEARTEIDGEYGKKIKVDPALGQCAAWLNMSMYAGLNKIDVEECYRTALVKELPEDMREVKNPKVSTIAKYLPWLEEEIFRVKPKIIVCLGKPVFDVLSGIKMRESDIYGLWYYAEKYNAKLYFIPGLHAVLKADLCERYMMDFESVYNMYESLNGVEVERLPIHSRICRNQFDVINLVKELEAADARVLSVDCEWGGQVHVDGMLRSLQIAWSDTDAAYIRFMDDEGNYDMDVGYKEIGYELGKWLNKPFVKYIGHHLSADLSWMHYWLGLDWYQKGIFDTEFALQTCDESLDLGLDVLALRYTDFGKYDWDLLKYRKAHPERKGTGYEFVPDDILIPYGLKDVLTVYRAWPKVRAWLERQPTRCGMTLADYYDDILNPFVTDVFTWFCIRGMPVDRPKLDVMRELYNWAKGELQKDFLSSVVREAEDMMKQELEKIGHGDVYDKLHELVKNPGTVNQARAVLSDTLLKYVDGGGTIDREFWDNMFNHYVESPEFNIRSSDQMRRWLYAVKKYEPVKTTSLKAKGMPSMDWVKVMAYPPEKRKEFTPAVDKMSLEIFAAKYHDKVLGELLELNSVGNVCKAFLKKRELDDEGNEVGPEKGIHHWVTSDDRLCLNHSTTETGRPRSWNPNVLNYPSWLHARLKSGMKRILADRESKGQLPDKFKQYLDSSKIPTVRSIVMARPGWCVVEADYQTAEMRGLAWISGDKEMQSQITDPDPNWAFVDPSLVPDGESQEDYVVRLGFPYYVTEPQDKEKFLLTRAKDGKILEQYTEEQLWRDDNGKVKGPRYDFHWGTAERGLHKCREVMNKKKDRGAGKVLNFASGYGGQAPSLKRKVDSDTGEDCPIETVENMLTAIRESHIVASMYLEYVEQAPRHADSRMVAASGRIRHIHTLGACVLRSKDNEYGMSAYELNKGIGALGRECRNFFLQESVGASASRACVKLVAFMMKYREAPYNLKGYPIVCLYDSVVVHCPYNERAIWQKALLLYMTLEVGWMYHDDRGKRVLRYPSDCELNAGWSTAPVHDEAVRLADTTFEPTPEHLKPVEDQLDADIAEYTADELKSVYNTWNIETPMEPVFSTDDE